MPQPGLIWLIPKEFAHRSPGHNRRGSKAQVLGCSCQSGRCPSSGARGVTSPESGQTGTARLGGDQHFVHLAEQVYLTSSCPLEVIGSMYWTGKCVDPQPCGLRSSCEAWGATHGRSKQSLCRAAVGRRASLHRATGPQGSQGGPFQEGMGDEAPGPAAVKVQVRLCQCRSGCLLCLES